MSQVNGGIKWLLRAEGLAIFLASIYIYSSQEFSWVTFGILFLVPDLSFLGYLINSKVGAIAYNALHSLIGAIICFSVGSVLNIESFILVSIIWFAHIGFDRALGYGLKYKKGFGYTHLGLIGKLKSA